MAFWLQKKCSQNANLQPERQFAARTPIRSQNANMQPEHQFNATRIFAAQTPVRCRLPVCSPNANLQPERQFAADLQPKRQFAANLQPKRQLAADCGLQPKRQFAARTPIRCPLAAQTPVRCRLRVCSPNANLQPERQFAVHLQPKRQLADLTHFCSPNAVEQRKRMHPSTGCVPAHTVLNVLSEIIGAVRPCLPHNACFPDNSAGPFVWEAYHVRCQKSRRACFRRSLRYEAPVFLARLFCFGSLVILDVAGCYL